MKKIAILTDTTGIAEQDITNGPDNIYYVPLNIIFGEQSFQEYYELKSADFYTKCATDPNHPKSSQPAVGLIAQKLEQLLQTYDQIICPVLSSELSGTYQSFCTLAQELAPDRIFVVDTHSLTGGLWFFVEKAAVMIEAGQSAEAIVAELEQMKSKVEVMVCVKELDFIRKGGRISHTSAFLGNMLQIKPILYFIDGRVEVLEKVRTSKKAVSTMLQRFYDQTPVDYDGIIIVGNSNNDELIEYMKAQIQEIRPQAQIKELIISAVIGVHGGPGSVGISWVNPQ
ncbi:MAG: DegV family protein [Culicoidibacterales bacterium]